jgi:peptidoglycan lytic transglycosylase
LNEDDGPDALPRHAIVRMLATALTSSAVLAAPALAQGGPGGFAVGTPQAGGATPFTPLAPVGGANAAGALYAQAGALLGTTVTITGSVAGASAGRTVEVERQARDGSWAPAAAGITAADGSFSARWRPDRTGQVALRADLTGGAGASTAQSAALPTLPTSTVTIYNAALATWYGPGFYGHRTACNKTMSRTLVGVAHKSLPCGTKVTFLYKGNTLTVPVVDRGPYAGGAKWDLTYAAAQQLGFTATDTVGRLLP